MARTDIGRAVPLLKGEYSPTTTYELNDIVSLNGSFYWHYSHEQTTNVAPQATSTWKVVINLADAEAYIARAEFAAESAEDAAEIATAAKTAAESASTTATGASATATAAKNDAVTAKTAAETAQAGAVTAKTAAETARDAAQASATAAGTSATNAGNSAGTAEYYAGIATTAGETANEKATEATGAATTATSAAATATSAKDTAVSSASTASTAATTATSAATAAQAVKDSIPEDYSQLSADVGDLKTQITNVEDILGTEAIVKIQASMYLMATLSFTTNLESTTRVSTKPIYVEGGKQIRVVAKGFGKYGYSESTNGTTVSSAQQFVNGNYFDKVFTGPIYFRCVFANAGDTTINPDDVTVSIVNTLDSVFTAKSTLHQQSGVNDVIRNNNIFEDARYLYNYNVRDLTISPKEYSGVHISGTGGGTVRISRNTINLQANKKYTFYSEVPQNLSAMSFAYYDKNVVSLSIGFANRAIVFTPSESYSDGYITFYITNREFNDDIYIYLCEGEHTEEEFNYWKSLSNSLKTVNENIDNIENDMLVLETNVYDALAPVATVPNKLNKPSLNPNGEYGQILHSNGDGTTTWENPAQPDPSDIENAVAEYFTTNPPTTVSEHSIVESSLRNDLKIKTIDYCTVPSIFQNGDLPANTDIAQAVNATLSTAGVTVVKIPPGIYDISETIVIPDGKTLVLEGDWRNENAPYTRLEATITGMKMVQLGSMSHLIGGRLRLKNYDNAIGIYIDSHNKNIAYSSIKGTTIWGGRQSGILTQKGVYVECDDMSEQSTEHGYLMLCNFDVHIGEMGTGYYFHRRRATGNNVWMTGNDIDGYIEGCTRSIYYDLADAVFANSGSTISAVMQARNPVENEEIHPGINIKGSDILILSKCWDYDGPRSHPAILLESTSRNIVIARSNSVECEDLENDVETHAVSLKTLVGNNSYREINITSAQKNGSDVLENIANKSYQIGNTVYLHAEFDIVTDLSSNDVLFTINADDFIDDYTAPIIQKADGNVFENVRISNTGNHNVIVLAGMTANQNRMVIDKVIILNRVSNYTM